MDSYLTSILNLNPIENIAILGFFSNYSIEDYFIENKSVLVFGRSDHFWAHISSSSADELSLLLSEYHSRTKYYFSVENWMIPLILKYGTSDWIMTTDRYILDPTIHINPPKVETIKIDNSFAPFIYKNSDYKDFISVEYITERLTKDISAGILINNKLAAWGFTHDDGALGFLHVLEDYRKRGFGMDILAGLIQQRKKEKKQIFGNIVPGNYSSIRLVNKHGFKLDRRVSWIKLK